jgi:formylglycine-generating enzyme required for sulfatase activity
LGLFANTAGAAVTLEMVTVGDPGNVGELSGDPNRGIQQRLCGAVGYVYQIGKYEVGMGQYRAFLNSVARYGDPYQLYTAAYYGGIIRTGLGTVGDPFIYSPKSSDPNWDTKAANEVSWYSALRFINWVQNGQPVSEAGPGVTETGTYVFGQAYVVIDEWGEAHTHYPVTIPDHSTLTTPHYVLPTEDEWYKAAFYKGGGTAAGYWDYATRSDTVPYNGPPEEDTGNSANFDGPPGNGYAVGPPYYLTDVGAYSLSVGPYGTYDQNGNVFEIMDIPYGSDGYVIRGSSWAYYQAGLEAWDRWGIDPDVAVADTGFRLGFVPEPGSVVLLSGGAGILACRYRRKRQTQLVIDPADLTRSGCLQ